jgi:P27 family predicted phage terminase small subunit
MAGRKRLPQKVKQARQTLRYCRENDNEPTFVLTQEIPDPPKYLSKVGRDVYYSTASELLSFGILTRVSLSLFVMYCIEVAVYFDAMERVYKESFVLVNKQGNFVPNPWIKIANDSLMATVRIATEFGITPASASKVNAINPGESDKSKLVKRLQGK